MRWDVSVTVTDEQFKKGVENVCKLEGKGRKFIDDFLDGKIVLRKKTIDISADVKVTHHKREKAGTRTIQFTKTIKYPTVASDILCCMIAANAGTVFTREKTKCVRNKKEPEATQHNPTTGPVITPEPPVQFQLPLEVEEHAQPPEEAAQAEAEAPTAEEPVAEPVEDTVEDPQNPEPSLEPLTAEIVPFHVSDSQVLDLVAIKTLQGRISVVVAKVCDILGVSVQRQVYKIGAREDWLSKHMFAQLSNDQVRSVFAIDLEDLPAWLNSINPQKVRPEVRAALIKLQKECSAVLRKHFFPNTERASQQERSPSEMFMQYIAEDRERQARLEEKREERQDKRDAAFMQMFNTKQEGFEARLDAIDELNRNTLRVVATGPDAPGKNKEWSLEEFVAEMNKKHCKRQGPHRGGPAYPYDTPGEKNFSNDHSWRRLTVRNVINIATRSGASREETSLWNQEKTFYRVSIKQEEFDLVEAHVIAWFEANTPRTQKANGGYDWNPESLYWHFTDLGLTGAALIAKVDEAYDKCKARVPLALELRHWAPAVRARVSRASKRAAVI